MSLFFKKNHRVNKDRFTIVENVCVSCGRKFEGHHNNKYCELCSDFRSLTSDHSYRAKKSGLSEHFTAYEWLLLCEWSGCICVKCKSDFSIYDLSPDHIIPLAKGGTNTIDNIQPMCISCNKQKKDCESIDYRDKNTIANIVALLSI